MPRKDKRIVVPRGVHVAMIWLLAAVVVLVSCEVTRPPGSVKAGLPGSDAVPGSLDGVQVPYCGDSDYVVANGAGRYTYLYDPDRRYAVWVAHILTSADCGGDGVGRSGRFVPDPQVQLRGWPTARDSHYTNSGYDRGHLLPSADRNDTEHENRTTFYLSNVAPQDPALNRGLWRTIEERVREWALGYDSLLVVTGTLVDAGCRRIAGGVAVPHTFYKTVMVRLADGRWSGVALVAPNAGPGKSGWRACMTTIDSLEQISGMDFYHLLPRQVEDAAESVVDYEVWY